MNLLNSQTPLRNQPSFIDGVHDWCAENLTGHSAIVTLVIAVGSLGVLGSLFALGNRTNLPLVYQGRLTDASFIPITDSSRDVRFKIWTALTGGTCVWSTGTSAVAATNCAAGDSATTSIPVAISGGLFTVPLGAGNEATTHNPEILLNFNSGSFYLETIVDNESTGFEALDPRKQLGGSLYSYASDLLDGLESTAFAILGGQSGGQTLVGGVSASDTLVLQATTGNGTTGNGMVFNVGNNGATTAMVITNAGKVGIGNVPDAKFQIYDAPVGQSHLRFGDTTAVSGTPAAKMTFTGNTVQHAGIMWTPVTAGIGKIQFTTGGNPDPVGQTVRFTIQNDGNIGVGTTAPTAPLTIATTTASTDRGARIYRYSTDTTNGVLRFFKARGTEAAPLTVANADTIGAFDFQAYDGTAYVQGATIGTGVSGAVSTGVMPTDLFFSTTATTTPVERMRITSAGNIGIGTTAPTTALHVGAGTAASTRDGAGNDFIPQIYSTATSGVAGIGVHVNDGVNNRRAGFFVDQINGVWGLNMKYGSGAIPFTIGNNAVERFRIDTAGKVGIGTTSPGAALHVVGGSVPAQYGLRLSNVETDATAKSGRIKTGHYTNSEEPVTLAILDTQVAANVLQIGGASSFENAVTRMQFFTAADNVTLAGSERMRITGTGNVGIGTTSPLTTLDLAGNLGTTGKATTVLTGDIDPTASATVLGTNGTLFLTELVVGDRITVNAETRTVTAIASNSSLTVDSAFTDTANDTDPDVLYALATMRDSANALKFVLNDAGSVGICTATPNPGKITSWDPVVTIGPSTTDRRAAILELQGNSATPFSSTDLGGLVARNVAASTIEKRVAQISMSIDGALGSGAYHFYTFTAGAATDRLTITNSGNIGVATTAPAQKFDVNGSALIALRDIEKVTNGGFGATCTGWTLGAGWTCDAINQWANHTSGTTLLERDVSAAAGETYAVSFSVSNTTLGSVTPAVGGASGVAVTTNGMVSQTVVAIGTGNLTFTPTTDFNGSIDIVSVKKLTGGNLYAMGNVGIGTTTPQGPFAVQQPGAVMITGSAQTTSGQYYFGEITGAHTSNILHVAGPTRGILNLWQASAPFSTSGSALKFNFAARSTTDSNTAQIAVVQAGANADNATTGGFMQFYTRPDAGAITERLRSTSDGHVEYLGTAPVISACGTSPSVVGNDMAGKVTIGTTPGTSCTITFATAWTNAPICMAIDETTATVMRPTTSTTVLTVNGTFVDGDVVSYICSGRR